MGYCFPFDAPDYLRDELGRGPCERDVSRWASHLLLPWVTFAIALAPVYARVLRVVAAARRADASLESVERTRRHRIRVLKVAKHLGRDFGFGLGLALLIETAFGLPGLGELMVATAVIEFDPPMSEAVLVVATTAAFTVHLIVGLVCGALEPELRRA